MTFDYATTGLPKNPHWERAVQICYDWISENMSMFGEKRIIAFMHKQPVAAAKRILELCDNPSEESVLLVLMGPGKWQLMLNEQAEQNARRIFGYNAVDLLRACQDEESTQDEDIRRDAGRIFLSEGISTMEDQMIGRDKVDKHHATRWKILRDLESVFIGMKGKDERLDAAFVVALEQSRAALERLDAEQQAVVMVQ